MAGCSGDSEEIAGGDHDRTATPPSVTTDVSTDPNRTPTMTPVGSTGRPTSGATDTASPTPTPTSVGPDVRIVDSSLQIQEDSFSSTAYIQGRITNEGDAPSGSLSLTGRFYDDSDTLLDSTTGSLHYLKPGETWACYLPYLDDASDVAGHTLDGDYRTDAPRFELENLAVTDTTLNKTEYSASVTGTIENDLDEEADYLASLARFWRDDVVIADGLDNITEVPPGEDWSFEASYFGYGDRWMEADGHDVIPELSIY